MKRPGLLGVLIFASIICLLAVLGLSVLSAGQTQERRASMEAQASMSQAKSAQPQTPQAAPAPLDRMHPKLIKTATFAMG